MPARPGRALVPVLTRCRPGIPLGDVLADSGYAHRDAGAWALPLRAGAQLVQDLHPHDRGPKGTHDGAIIANGNLYCPATPRTLTELGPLPRDPPRNKPPRTTRQHRRTRPLQARPHHPRRRRRLPPRRLPRGHGQDPLPAAPAIDDPRPGPPGDPPAPRRPPGLLHPADPHRATRGHRQTAQKHDYPSKAHRRSYARRTGAERGFATAKDPATNTISRGWCRLMGLTPLMLFAVTLLIVRNQRLLAAWDARQAENARRAAAGLPPRTRKRRRKTLTVLATATRPP